MNNLLFITAITLFSTGLLQQLCLADECEIEGLPPGILNTDPIFSLATKEPILELNLACKCSEYSPKWQVQKLGDTLIQPENYPHETSKQVQCINNTHPCNSNISFISPVNKSQGLYLYLNLSLQITETTVLVCFSDINKKVFIVSVLDQEDQPRPTATSTTGTSTDVPQPSSTATHIPNRSSHVEHIASSPTPLITTVTVTQHTVSTVTIPASSCSSKLLTTPSPTPSPGIIDNSGKDKTISDSIIQNVGGPSTLALVPVVIVLIILSITLCGLLVCSVKMRRNERRRHREFERRRDSNSSINQATSIDRLLQQQYQQQLKEEKRRKKGEERGGTRTKSTSDSYQQKQEEEQRKRSDVTNPMWTTEEGRIHLSNIPTYTTIHQLNTTMCTNRSDSLDSEV